MSGRARGRTGLAAAAEDLAIELGRWIRRQRTRDEARRFVRSRVDLGDEVFTRHPDVVRHFDEMSVVEQVARELGPTPLTEAPLSPRLAAKRVRDLRVAIDCLFQLEDERAGR